MTTILAHQTLITILTTMFQCKSTGTEQTKKAEQHETTKKQSVPTEIMARKPTEDTVTLINEVGKSIGENMPNCIILVVAWLDLKLSSKLIEMC